MAQRDYEEQPEAPDLGASVQLESSQTLAAPAGDRDGVEAGYVPPDRPYVLEDNSMTAGGMRRGDTLDERLAREVPEGEPGGDPDRAGRIAIADEGIALETPDAMDGVDVGIDGGGASAEEAAVHVVDGGFGVDGEPSVAADPALADPEVDALLADDDGTVDEARADAARDVTGVLDADRT
nr:hypothetical protein [uncultured bacterium]